MATLHILSTVVVALIVAGVLSRRNTPVHIRLMTAAFVIDLGLVLYIEATRHAVERAVGPAGPLIWFHAGVSTLVLVLYVAQITLGRRLLAGRPSSHRLHMVLGLTFCLCRGLNYATSFVVSSNVPQPAAIQAQAIDAAPPAASRPVPFLD